MTLNIPRNTTLYSLGKSIDFRAASSALFTWKPHFDGFGTNLQNQTDRLKGIYIPDEGYKLGKVDQSGAEALIVAYLCKAGKYRDLFIYDIKVHSFVALHLFKEVWKRELLQYDIECLCSLAPKDLPTHPHFKEVFKYIKSSDHWESAKRYYFFAKQTSHSGNYGIRGPTFMMNTLEKSWGKVALSKKDADFFLAFYRSLFPEIPQWNCDIADVVSRTRKLFNLFGHPREFFGVDGDELYREAYAFIPQSTVGEITHMAFRDFQHQIETEKRDWHLLNNEHDSMMWEFPDSPIEERESMAAAKKHIERHLVSPEGIKFQMKSEGYVGYNWSEMHEYKIINGQESQTSSQTSKELPQS